MKSHETRGELVLGNSLPHNDALDFIGDVNVDNIISINTHGVEVIIEDDVPHLPAESIENLMEHDISAISANFLKMAMLFSIELHSKPNLCRKDVTDICNVVEKYIIRPISDVFNTVMKSLVKDEDSQIVAEQIATLIQNFFSETKSEHLLIKSLQENNLMKPLSQYTINKEISPTFSNGVYTLTESETTAVFFPLEFQLKSIFTNLILQKSLKTIEKLQNEPGLTNFVQGDLWSEKRSKFSKEQKLIPYFLYVTMFYISFPNLDDPLLLSNIQLAAVIEAKHFKQFGVDCCLSKFVDMLKALEEEGVDFENMGQKENVKFVLVLVIGDNLGLNYML